MATFEEKLQNMTLHAHFGQDNTVEDAWYAENPRNVIEDAVADYLHQMAEPG